MQLVTRPKLLPPLALLRQAPAGGPLIKVPTERSGTLSPNELRRIVADLLG